MYVCLHYNRKYRYNIHNRFQNFDLSVAFKTSDTLANILHPTDKF